MSELTPNNTSQFIIYQTESGQTKIEVRLENETVWLTQKLMAELFQVAKSSISEHIKHIYEEGELVREATVQNFRTVQAEGERKVTRELECYNLPLVPKLQLRETGSWSFLHRIPKQELGNAQKNKSADSKDSK